MCAVNAKRKKGSVAKPLSQGSRGSRSASSRLPPVFFYSRWCKKCGLCAAFCARGCIEIGADGIPVLVKPERCNSCGLCELLCPDFAIEVPNRHTKT